MEPILEMCKPKPLSPSEVDLTMVVFKKEIQIEQEVHHEIKLEVTPSFNQQVISHSETAPTYEAGTFWI